VDSRHDSVVNTNRAARRADTVAFFGPRAAGWDTRFADDGPAFGAAVRQLGPPRGGVALDAGCGTGRAVPALAEAVGPDGTVVAVDVTLEMLAALTAAGRRGDGRAVRADACELPLATGSVDAVFAGGLLPHVTDPHQCLFELARVARPGARLAVFHPIGRVALAARHGRTPSPDDVLGPGRLAGLLTAAGWRAVSIDDGTERYLAVAERIGD
jgi:SAM-dependent methyltransferase